MCGSGFWPGITQGLPGTRGSSASTFAAGGDSGTARGPVLLSRSLNSLASRSMSVRCRDRISLLRQPVSIRSRIADTAWTDTPPSVGASPRTSPRRRNSVSVRNRSRPRAGYLRTDRQGLVPSGTISQSAAIAYMRDISATAWFAA